MALVELLIDNCDSDLITYVKSIIAQALQAQKREGKFGQPTVNLINLFAVYRIS